MNVIYRSPVSRIVVAWRISVNLIDFDNVNSGDEFGIFPKSCTSIMFRSHACQPRTGMPFLVSREMGWGSGNTSGQDMSRDNVTTPGYR